MTNEQILAAIEAAIAPLRAELCAIQSGGRNIRRRIHASTSVKGVKHLEHTLEAPGYTLEEALAEWDAQDAAVEARQPAGGE